MNGGSGRGRWHGAVFALTLFFVFALSAEGLAPAIAQAKTKRHQGVHGQIVGGHPVPQGELTFMAYIAVDTEDDSFFCGGALIAPSFVLTAAHCVTDDVSGVIDADAFLLTIGAADLNDFDHGVDRGVVEVTPHPAWDPAISLENDVALLELDAPVPGSVAQPIAIVGAGQTEFNNAGQPTTVAGWGAIWEGGPVSDQLLEANVDVVSDAACGDAFGTGFVPSVMICAAHPGRDSCSGDSGGPLFAKHLVGTKKVKVDAKKKHHKKKGKRKHHKTKKVPVFQNIEIGIVSFGGDCADPDFPGVYTRLSAPVINTFITGVLNS